MNAELSGMKIAYVEIDSLLAKYNFCIDLNEAMVKKSENVRMTLNQKRKGHKKTCPKLHSLEQEHYNLHISNINNEISFIREKLKKVTY